MFQFRQRIDLIHKLRQLGKSEKFFDRRHQGPGVDKLRRRQHIDIVGAHAVANDPVHSCHSDAQFRLQKFSERAHPAVAQMINIVRHGVFGIVQADDFGDNIP